MLSDTDISDVNNADVDALFAELGDESDAPDAKPVDFTCPNCGFNPKAHAEQVSVATEDANG